MLLLRFSRGCSVGAALLLLAAFSAPTAFAQTDYVNYTHSSTSGTSIVTTQATPPSPGSEFRGTLSTSFTRSGSSVLTGGQIIIEPVIDPIVRLGLSMTNLSGGPLSFFEFRLPEATDLYFLQDTFASSFDFSRISFSNPVAKTQNNERGFRTIRFDVDPSQGDVPLAMNQKGYFQFRMRVPNDGRFIMLVNPTDDSIPLLIPEPGSAALCVAGLMPLIGLVRRSRRRGGI